MLALLDLLPVQCAGCRATGASPCPGCASAFEFDRLPVHRAASTDHGPDSLIALLHYDEASRPFITAAKNLGAWSSFGWFAPRVAERVHTELGPTVPGAVVTWAPTTAERRARRGFDHAQLLARRVAVALGLPCRALLRRSGSVRQTGRSATERRNGPRFVPRVRTHGPVLVVDDVLTTGATLRAASEALRTAGATSVHGLVLARTPLRG